MRRQIIAGKAIESVTADFRPCPFCASSDLTIATATDETTTTVAVICLECGATGPKGSAADPVVNIEYR